MRRRSLWSHLERALSVLSAPRARATVAWLHSGHESFQECKKALSSMLEQLVTGFHDHGDAGVYRRLQVFLFSFGLLVMYLSSPVYRSCWRQSRTTCRGLDEFDFQRVGHDPGCAGVHFPRLLAPFMYLAPHLIPFPTLQAVFRPTVAYKPAEDRFIDNTLAAGVC